MLKKIIAVLASIAIIAGVGYGAANYLVNASSSQDESLDEISKLLKELEQETGIEFSDIQPAIIKWVVSVQPKVQDISINGKGFEVEGISEEQKAEIESFLKSKGFKVDLYNIADGTFVGLAGYKKEDIACTVAGGATGYKTATGQWIPPEPGKNDIEVKCGELEHDSNTTIETKMGDIFSIVLDANPTTGYQWEVEIDSDNIQLIDREYITSSKEPVPGAGGYETFNFFALKPGNTNIKFSYLRSWEGDVIETLVYEIIIR